MRLKKDLKKLLLNQKGTAEVIGSILFIVILMFFFANVYLWHDAATKEMNALYVARVNSPIVVELAPDGSGLVVTNKGGVDTELTMLWVNVKASGGGPDSAHYNFPLDKAVIAGGSVNIAFSELPYSPSGHTVFKAITTLGNSASCTYNP